MIRAMDSRKKCGEIVDDYFRFNLAVSAIGNNDERGKKKEIKKVTLANPVIFRGLKYNMLDGYL